MRIIDTKIGTSQERPQLKIGDKLYKVDNRKKTFDEIQKVQESDKSLDEKNQLMMELALGKSEAKEVLNMDLTVEEYTYLTFCVISAITGQDVEELEKETKLQKN